MWRGSIRNGCLAVDDEYNPKEESRLGGPYAARVRITILPMAHEGDDFDTDEDLRRGGDTPKCNTTQLVLPGRVHQNERCPGMGLACG